MSDHDERIDAWEAVAEHPTLRPAFDVEGPLLPAVLHRLTDLGDLERRQPNAMRNAKLAWFGLGYAVGVIVTWAWSVFR